MLLKMKLSIINHVFYLKYCTLKYAQFECQMFIAFLSFKLTTKKWYSESENHRLKVPSCKFEARDFLTILLSILQIYSWMNVILINNNLISI